MGRQGKHQVGSVNKNIAVELVGQSWSDSDKAVGLFFREKLVYVRLTGIRYGGNGYRAEHVLTRTVTDLGLGAGAVMGKENHQLPFLVGVPRIRKGEAILDRNRENRERKGETDGEGLRSARRTDRILSPTTLEFSGGLTDHLRCVGFWFEDTKQAYGLRRDWYQQYDRGTKMECDWNCTSCGGESQTLFDNRSRIPCVPGSCRSQKNGFGEEIRFGRASYMEIFKPHVIYQDVPLMVESSNNFNGLIVLLDKWFKEALGMDVLDQCQVNLIEKILG
ncbi:hypothetical protein DY000_02008849 [Brassica cretica]|uniref:Uncharacterized protein n=1 Tax=Brassica cretica TaxID=69181 RepID=A0ABQ7BU26_BRACR|nr:hypothetical protein DY000_02008849 [Brassica cretica]